MSNKHKYCIGLVLIIVASILIIYAIINKVSGLHFITLALTVVASLLSRPYIEELKAKKDRDESKQECLTAASIFHIIKEKLFRDDFFYFGGTFMPEKNKVILTCSECLARNYSTHKNKKTNLERLELYKYCRYCNKKTLHKETK